VLVRAAGALAAALPGMACGPVGGAPTSSAPSRAADAGVAGRLSFMHYRAADEQPIIQEMVDAFVAQHQGLTVEVVAQPDDFDAKLQILLAAGTAPDVYYAKPESYGYYVQRGHMASLTPLIKRGRFDLADFFPGSFSQYQIRGQTYALPRGYAPNTFYVNLELFRKEGARLPAVDWKDATWTWAKLLKESPTPS
jgi:multiple sugar transport system substrate-binding protein